MKKSLPILLFLHFFHLFFIFFCYVGDLVSFGQSQLWGRVMEIIGQGALVQDVKRNQVMIPIDDMRPKNPEYTGLICPICFNPFVPNMTMGRRLACLNNLKVFMPCGHTCCKACEEKLPKDQFSDIVTCHFCRVHRESDSGILYFDLGEEIPTCFHCRQRLHTDMKIIRDVDGFCCPFCNLSGRHNSFFGEYSNTQVFLVFD